MQQIEINPIVNVTSLDEALRPITPAFLGFRAETPPGGFPTRVELLASDDLRPSDLTALETVIAAHDPVFLSVDKTTIQANGQDEATITVHAPKVGAAPATLLIGSTEVAVNLSNGIGEVGITSPDPQTITVTVKNPANRSSDTIRIQAVM